MKVDLNGEVIGMKCEKCPLYSWWNNENDKGESCGLFGDSWDNPLQYEDKEGTTIGCYVDRHYIEKADERYMECLSIMADGINEMIEKERSEHEKLFLT